MLIFWSGAEFTTTCRLMPQLTLVDNVAYGLNNCRYHGPMLEKYQMGQSQRYVIGSGHRLSIYLVT